MVVAGVGDEQQVAVAAVTSGRNGERFARSEILVDAKRRGGSSCWRRRS
jgi:hypothetical protein